MHNERGTVFMTVTLKKVKLKNGETIAYRERENGDQIVVFIHGNMTSSLHWDVLFETLPEKYKLYAIDLRGFGASSYHKPINEIKDFSEDIKQFIDKLGFRTITLVGWSLGGAVAMQFVADHPHMVNKLLLLASASTRGYPFYASFHDGTPNVAKRLTSLNEIKQDPMKTIPIQRAYDKRDQKFLTLLWDSLIYRNKKPSMPRYHTYIEDMCTQRNLPEVYHALNLFNISDRHNGLTNGTNQAKDITIPVLVMHGDEDAVVNKQMTEEILEDLGGQVKFLRLKGCGHSPLIDDLDQLTEGMVRFIDN